MMFPEQSMATPRFSAPGSGGSGTPPDANTPINQIAQQKIDQHQQDQSHLTEQDVRAIVRKKTLPTASDLADAINQDPQPVVDVLSPLLPGGQTDPTEIRKLAREEIIATHRNQVADGWINGDDANQLIQDKIDDGTLATNASLQQMQTRMPQGNGPLASQDQLRAAEQGLQASITTVQQNVNATNARIPDNIVTQQILNRRLPAPTLGQRLGAFLGDRDARRYVNHYDNPPAAVVIQPATADVDDDSISRRNLLVGAGAVLIGGTVCAVFGLPAIANFIERTQENYPPSGSSNGGTNNPPSNGSSGEQPYQIANGATQEVQGNSVISGDVVVDGHKDFDTGPGSENTGSVVELFNSKQVSAPYGATVTPVSDPSQMDAVAQRIKQQMSATGCMNGCTGGVTIYTEH